MKITMDLQVPADYFFQRLVDSVLQDIKQQTGRQLAERALPGYRYHKEFGNKQTGELKVLHFLHGRRYGYSLRTGRNEYFVDYELTPQGADSCILSYSEQQKGRDAKVTANNKTASFFLGWFRKRRFKKMAAEISVAYRDQQKEEA